MMDEFTRITWPLSMRRCTTERDYGNYEAKELWTVPHLSSGPSTDDHGLSRKRISVLANVLNHSLTATLAS